MQSDRLIINNYDQSTVIENDLLDSVLGFTIVDAPSGPKTPVLVNNTSELRSIFGKSSALYPELYEVEKFVDGGYSCFVGNSKSTEADTVPCVLVCKSGRYLTSIKYPGSDILTTEPTIVTNGVSAGYSGNTEEKVTYLKYIPVSLGTTVVSNTTVQCLDFDMSSFSGSLESQTLVIYRIDNNGILNIHRTSEPQNLNSGSNSTIVSITSLSDGWLNSSDISAMTTSDLSNYSFYLESTVESNDIVAYVMPKYPSNYTTGKINITTASNKLDDNVANSVKNNVVYINSYSIDNTGTVVNNVSNILGSFGPVSGFRLFDESNGDFLSQKSFNIYYTNNSFIDDNSVVTSANMILGSSSLGSGSSAGVKDWSLANDSLYDNVDLFFDPRFHTADDNIYSNSGFFSLHKTHPFAGCIFNQTWDNTSGSNPTKLTYGSSYWNICGRVRINTGSEYLFSSLVGAKALLQAQIIDENNGGTAPMFTTGNLSMSVLATNLSYRYKKSELTMLDSMNYNPVIYDSTYGLMVTSQKTCKGGATTDWSYIGHVSAFFNFQKEVYNQVMIPQLGKQNNPYYRELRKQQVEHILEERLVTNRIWAEGIVDTSTSEGINDDYNRKARKFVIVVKVKVDIFSEYVVLNFYNVDQSTVLSSNN